LSRDHAFVITVGVKRLFNPLGHATDYGSDAPTTIKLLNLNTDIRFTFATFD